MPRYDFECPHGHRFEYDCRIEERNDSVPCQGEVNQLASDEDLKRFRELAAEQNPVFIDDVEFKLISLDHPEGEAPTEAAEVVVKKVSCMLKAKLLVGTHNNPAALLEKGMCRNRDAAREGRYDPLNPSRRFMAKGRGM